MGFRYQLDGSTTPIAPLSDDVIRNYTSSIEPGCRLPHGWLMRNDQRISSLDLIGLTKATVIAGPSAKPDVDCLQVGRDFDDPDNWWGKVLGLSNDAEITIRPDQHITSR